MSGGIKKVSDQNGKLRQSADGQILDVEIRFPLQEQAVVLGDYGQLVVRKCDRTIKLVQQSAEPDLARVTHVCASQRPRIRDMSVKSRIALNSIP